MAEGSPRAPTSRSSAPGFPACAPRGRLPTRVSEVIVLEARERVGGRLLNASSRRRRSGRPRRPVGRLRSLPGSGPRRRARHRALPPVRRGQEPARRQRHAAPLPRHDSAPRPQRALGHLPRPAPHRQARAGRRRRAALGGGARRRAGRPDARRLVRGKRADADCPRADRPGRAHVWGAGPEELSMLHVLFYVSSAGSFDKLIDTEGGAQQDRLVGGAQALALRPRLIARRARSAWRAGAADRAARGFVAGAAPTGWRLRRRRRSSPCRPRSPPDRVRPALAGGAQAARRALAAGAPQQVHRALRDSVLASARAQRRVGDRRRPGDPDLRLLAAGRFGRGDAWLRRRPRGARDGGAWRRASGGRRCWPASSASSVRRRRSRSTTPNRPGRRRNGPAEVRPPISAPAAGATAARCCASPAGSSTGPEPRRRRSGAATWRALCRPASGPRPRLLAAVAPS